MNVDPKLIEAPTTKQFVEAFVAQDELLHVFEGDLELRGPLGEEHLVAVPAEEGLLRGFKVLKESRLGPEFLTALDAAFVFTTGEDSFSIVLIVSHRPLEEGLTVDDPLPHDLLLHPWLEK